MLTCYRRLAIAIVKESAPQQARVRLKIGASYFVFNDDFLEACDTKKQFVVRVI